MQILSLVWGLLATIGLVIGFVPCFGALNWLNIPFAGVGLVVSAIAVFTGEGRERAYSLAGIACCSLALVIGVLRLIVGQGIL
jgi:hypothetical protein